MINAEYETEKYSEAENELDTYDEPVKLVMEYRISEKQKDSQIAELQKQLEETKQTGSYQVMLMCQKENILLKQQLKSQPKEIVEKIKKWGQKHYNWVGDGTGYDGQNYNECIGFNMAIDQLNEILDAILNGVSYD